MNTTVPHHVLANGIATSIVDSGRIGRASIGCSRGGAVDLESYSLADRLLGNRSPSIMFETSGGFRVRFDAAVLVVVTGALCELTVVDGPPIGWGAPVWIPAGATVSVGRLITGARVYVAVRGGLNGRADIGPTSGVTAPHPRRDSAIRIWPGPRLDWFGRDTWNSLLAASLQVVATSRVGVRLSAIDLRREHREELPSEGVIEGAVQMPPDGAPIVMLADHPVTGGYPVLAVVDRSDLHLVAQLPVGTSLRLRPAR